MNWGMESVQDSEALRIWEYLMWNYKLADKKIFSFKGGKQSG